MHNTKISPFIILVFAAGFGGIVAQTILLRELLVLFSGNEYSIGIIISAWVISESIGAYTGGKFNKTFNPEILTYSVLLFSIIFPICIYLTRIFKSLLDIPPGVGVGMVSILYSSFIILFPIGLLHGFFFTIACSVHNQMTDKGKISAGRIYFYETLGTIAGGTVVSIFFVPFFNSFFIAMIIAVMGAISCIIFVKSADVFQLGRKNRLLLLSSSILSIMVCIMMIFNVDNKIHMASINIQWAKQNVVSYKNSIYQNIVVVKNEDQYTFFTDGIPFVTTPVPDIAFVEEFAHFPILAHPQPKDILVIGGGTGGIINEISKHRTVKKIDYIEIDPDFLKTIKRFPTSLTEIELNNPIVKLHYKDGRRFLRKTEDKYDVILIGLPPPSTLQMNRFYTLEFYNLIKNALNTDGILALTTPGSYSYYGNTLKELNASIIETVKSAFLYVFILPGEYNIIFASQSKRITGLSPTLLNNALAERQIETKLITLPHLNDRFENNRFMWFASSLEGTKVQINRDFSPMGLFYSISYQNMLFSPSLKSVFEFVKQINTTSLFVFIISIFLFFLLLCRKHRHIGIPYAITTTGLSAMVFELILIFSFQVFCGYVYYEIGILITVFMAGMAAGSLIVTYRHNLSFQQSLSGMKALDTAMIIFPLFFALISLFQGYLYSIPTSSIRFIFYTLLIISGFLAGMQFPLSNIIYLELVGLEYRDKNKAIGNTAGILYGLDLIGACLGGIIGGLIVLPVLGTSNTCLFLSALKGTSLILLYTVPKNTDHLRRPS